MPPPRRLPTATPSFPPSPSLQTYYLSFYCTHLLSSASSLLELRAIHARAISHGVAGHVAFATKLLAAAAALASPSVSYARHVFDAAPHRDAFLWNTFLRVYATASPCGEVPVLYKQMRSSGLAPDHFTFPVVLRACTVGRAYQLGKQVHGDVVKNGFGADHFVQSTLVAMYSQGGEVSDAEVVFGEMRLRTVVSWTAMIAGYVQNCIFRRAIGVFGSMVASGILPNEITLISVLPCLRGLEFLASGQMVHGFVIKSGFEANVELVNALIAMYGKCGTMSVAKSLFEEMAERSLVSWNTMIAVYEQSGDGVRAIKVFRRMLAEKVGFDCVTLVSVLSACALAGALETGRWVHNLAKHHGLDTDVRIVNVLVDMYAKCGTIDYAREAFDSLCERSVVSWSAMISAYAKHGEPGEALKLFSLMKEEGIRPNSFTFTAVLVACGHSGLVDEGLKHFDSMGIDYQMTPTLEHYACMVDMLGRAGRLVEAYEFIRKMTVRPDKCVWVAFLGGCRIHQNIDLAEFVARDLFRSGSNDVTFYVLMANMYTEAGMWEDAAKIRSIMIEMELKKVAGRSLVCSEREVQSRAVMR